MQREVMSVWVCLACCLFSHCVLASVQSSAVETSVHEIEVRDGFAGHFIRGDVRVSPLADTQDGAVRLSIGDTEATGWKAANPQWDSSQVADGWHEMELTEQGRQHKVSVAVVNDPQIEVHWGTITRHETWSREKIHLVKHWVQVMNGRLLTIESGAVVKFFPHTGIRVDGVLDAQNVRFTSIHDDSVGGDTDMNGSEVAPPPTPDYAINGNLTEMSQPVETGYGTVECRDDLGGRLVRGSVRLSPVAEQRDDGATVTVDEQTASDWSPVAPQWQSEQVNDGWHKVTLSEGGTTQTTELACLNTSQVELHGGVMRGDEQWAADKVHVIQHWVRIPRGVTLTVAPESVVKFCPHAGMVVDGLLNAQKAIFTTSDDDTAGGDTDMDGDRVNGGGVDIVVNGEIDLSGSEVRQAERLLLDDSWLPGSVHTIFSKLIIPAGKRLVLQPGAIVKLASGARMEVAEGGHVVCDGAIFTHLADDSIGGDSEKDGDATKPQHDRYNLVGFFPPETSDLRYFSQIYAGWNLIAAGAELRDTPANASLLDGLNAFAIRDECFQRLDLPLPAGTLLWVHGSSNHRLTPDFGAVGNCEEVLVAGWNLIGVGESGRLLDAGSYSCVWTYRNGQFMLVSPSSDGSVTLMGGRGYAVYK